MRNKLGDLNNHLFAEMERLSDEELTGDKLQEELNRAKVITGVASQIIANGTLVLKAQMARKDCMDADFKVPEMLTEGKADA